MNTECKLAQPFWKASAGAAAKSRQSCLTLCGPIDGSPPGSSVPRILQARPGVGLPFPSPMHESESEVGQSCLTLCDPMDCSLPGSSVHGIFQSRVLDWGALPSPWEASRLYENLKEYLCFNPKIHSTLVIKACILQLLHVTGDAGKTSFKTGGFWWLNGEESACQCRRHGSYPWSRKISAPHATGQLSPCPTTSLCSRAQEPQLLKPLSLEPRLLHEKTGEATKMRSLYTATREEPCSLQTRESLRTATKPSTAKTNKTLKKKAYQKKK